MNINDLLLSDSWPQFSIEKAVKSSRSSIQILLHAIPQIFYCQAASRCAHVNPQIHFPEHLKSEAIYGTMKKKSKYIKKKCFFSPRCINSPANPRRISLSRRRIESSRSKNKPEMQTPKAYGARNNKKNKSVKV